MIGKTLGHYEIVEKVGAGGMGEVFRARDAKLGRDVALKLLPEAFTNDAERLGRFQHEARAIAALQHPNIVTIHSVEEADGRHFITMEFLDGPTLAQLLKPGGLSVEDFLEYATPIADAVAHAHAHDIAHRDLKPSNFMSDAAGRIKVLDFGLAKITAFTPESGIATVAAGPTTREGHVLGTAAYMSPEQAGGKTVDVRSDVFSLGIVFYEMLTGDRPFKGDNEITTITSILRDTPVPVTTLNPSLPPDVGRIVRRCLEKDPERRFETARGIRNELETLAEDMRGGAPRVSSSGPAAAPMFTPGTASTPPVTDGAAGSPPHSLHTGAASTPPLSDPPAPPLPPSHPTLTSQAPTSSRTTWVFGAIAVVALIAATAAWLQRSGGSNANDATSATGQAAETPVVPAPPPASVDNATKATPTIVVFPFENLGSADEAYFSAGMTDEITTRLTHVDGLSVLSRTTAVNYDRSGKTLQQIAADLGVDYVLEGSVRWERRSSGPERVRVTPQLVRARDDSHIWGESYDATMEEVFSVQSEIAEQVVSRLGMKLLGDERRAMRDVPTHNMDAYHAYLRGTKLSRETRTEEESRTAGRMFELAIQHDPEFIEAYARASMNYSNMAHNEWDRSASSLERAKLLAERALELDPDSPWGHAAMGYYHYWGLKDYEPALAAFERAEGTPPDVAKIGVAYVQRRLGLFEQALAVFEEIYELDPQNQDVLFNLCIMNAARGHYEDAIAANELLISKEPDRIAFRVNRLWITLLSGDRRGARELARRLESYPGLEGIHTGEQVSYYGCLLQLGQFERALEVAGRLPELREEQFGVVCRPLALAHVHAVMGQTDKARENYSLAAEVLEEYIRNHPEAGNPHAALGQAYAGLGRRDEAIREGRRALDMFPANRDAWIRPFIVLDLVTIYAAVGELDAAMDLLEKILSGPTLATSVHVLVDETRLAPLRDHPRFRALIESAL